jgi:two-component system copper resistance phosphate regulon response regulator CusR
MSLLVIADEERVALSLQKGLRANGYTVEWLPGGPESLRRALEPGITLVILDLDLLRMDGLDMLSRLRQRGATVPVLALSVRGGVEHRVRGLDLGADDYLAKPFAFEELLARVRAHLRPRASPPPGVLHVGGMSIDLLRHEAMVRGRTVSLSAREISLLNVFISHPGQVLSRQELLSMAWGMSFDPRTNLVDVYVRYLRRKLGSSVIETIRGSGYRLRIGGR